MEQPNEDKIEYFAYPNSSAFVPSPQAYSTISTQPLHNGYPYAAYPTFIHPWNGNPQHLQQQYLNSHTMLLNPWNQHTTQIMQPSNGDYQNNLKRTHDNMSRSESKYNEKVHTKDKKSNFPSSQPATTIDQPDESKKGVLQCNVCPKRVFYSIQELEGHSHGKSHTRSLQSLVSRPEFLFSCLACSKDYSYMSQLKSHTESDSEHAKKVGDFISN